MSNQNQFTQEQLDSLNSNPFTFKASGGSIRFTLEFKEFYYSKFQEGKLTTSQIFKAAGYDPNILGTYRMANTRRRILEEAKSPDGFRSPKGLSNQEELKKAQTETAEAKSANEKIRYLENRVEKLEAQVEFLKKTAHIRKQFQKPQNK